MKFEQYYAEIDEVELKAFHDKAYVSIQWKGTSVCGDVHCSCGTHCHVDAEFFYNYECPVCHKRYAVGSCVSLIELTPEQAKYWEGYFVGEA